MHDTPHVTTHEHTGFDSGEPKVRYIAVAGVALFVVLAAIILGVQWYYDTVHEQQVFVKQLEPVSQDLKVLRAREEADLTQYRYIDRAKGTVRLPIERAMELVVKERSDGK
ncbi:MAG TPA: hypothetical protein VN428_22160 [Bryobacteraceae bacterium]|nr:hypothetical protein [Bryobacteraceae bacterium]